MALMLSRSSHLILKVTAFLGVALAPEMGFGQSPQITIATWGGVYGSAQEAAILKPFTRATGIGVRLHQHGGDLQSLLEGTQSSGWAVVDEECSPKEIHFTEQEARGIAKQGI